MLQLVCMDSVFVCIHVCLFMSNSLDVVPKNSDMVQLCCFTGARTHTHIPLSLDSVRCQKLGAHLTLSDPVPTFRLFSTQLLHSVDHTRAPDTHFLNHLGNFPGCYPSSFCQDSQCPSVHTTALCVFVCMWKRSVEYTAPYLNI